MTLFHVRVQFVPDHAMFSPSSMRAHQVACSIHFIPVIERRPQMGVVEVVDSRKQLRGRP